MVRTPRLAEASPLRKLPRPVLEFPDDVERDEVKIVRREMPLQRSGERSAGIAERTGACVHELPCRAGRNVMGYLILDTRAISQLAIDRQDCVAVGFRNW